MSGVEDLNVPVGVVPSSCLETTVIVPRKDMIFPSLEALKEAYITFADSQGFGVKILNSHYDDEKILKRVTFACSKAGSAPKKTPSTKPVSVFHRKTTRTNCQARLQATMLDTGEYGVLNVFLEHNHDLLDPEMARSLRKKREVSLSKKRRIASNDKTRLGAPKTMSSSKTMSSYAIEVDNNLVPYSLQNVSRLSLMSSTSAPMDDSSKGAGQSVDPEMEDEYTHQSKLLQEFVSMSSINKAWIFRSNSGSDSQAIFSVSQPNLFSNAKKTLILSSHISKNANHPVRFHWSPFPIEMSGVSTIVPSPSGSKLLVVRNKDDGSPTLLEIWSQSKLEKELRIPQSVHGPFFTDGWFEGISWNQDENQIAYVAEEPSRAQPTFDDLGFKKEGSSEKDNGCWKGQGDWEEDWGETYSRKRNPALFVINTENGEVRSVKGVARSLSVGQVIWAPLATANSPSYLVFVGWTQEQKTAIRKLGMKYCYNRPCSLYAVQSPFDDSKLDATETNDSTEGSLAAVKFIPKISSAFSPLFSPDGKSLLFLSAKSSVDSGVHSATNSLHRIDWPIGEIPGSPTNIYDVVPVVMCAEDGCFPGLYCSNMLPNPWLSDGCRIVLSSYWHSVQVILAIDVFSGKISRVTPTDSNNSWDVLSLDGDNILAVSSSPVDPPQIKYGCYEQNKKQSISWNWIGVSSSLPGCSEKVKCLLSSLKFDVLKIPISDSPENLTEGSKKPIEAIYISSSSDQSEGDKNTPLIVMLHGGPHSVSLTSYSKNLAFLAALGYKLLSVNYRGSLGFGEDALQSLPGKIGSQDVNDVLVAMDHAIKMGLADPSKIAVLGGSHGGFLTTHLIGQAPDRFAVAAVRNPVCNLSLMVGTSDIPDWCFVSAYGSNGMNYYTEAPTMDHLRHLFNRSPIYHLPKVRAPTLFLLGAQDLRVPVSNGLQYARALKEKGNEVKVVVFPNDTHAIERPQSDFESFLNIGVWFKKYCR